MEAIEAVKDTTVRRFKRIRIALMRSPMFMELASVMMMGTTKIVDDVPTACTDGVNELYGRAFIESLNDKGLGFTIMHESMHKLCRHLTVYHTLWTKDSRRTNMACDYWINGKLRLADPSGTLIMMPMKDGKPIGLDNPQYDGMTVKAIWDALEGRGGKGGEQGEKGEEGEKGKGGEQGDGGGGGFDDHDWKSAGELTKEQQEEIRRELDQAIRQGKAAAKAAGVGAGGLTIELDNLINPQVDWREQLREFVRSTCADKTTSSWRRPNRRFLHQDIYMPTMVGESIKELVVAVDVSGSMFDGTLGKVMSEVKGLTEAMSIDKVHVLYWDGKVEVHEEYDAASFKDWQQVSKPSGGGGTTPACIPLYLREKVITPDAVVVLTDGEVGEWGVWELPVLWVISNKNTIVAPTGKTIQLKDD